MAERKDFYEILGVSRQASPVEIKTAYRHLAMQHHPDRNSHSKKEESERLFKDVKEAYETLTAREKHSLYDIFENVSGLSTASILFKSWEKTASQVTAFSIFATALPVFLWAENAKTFCGVSSSRAPHSPPGNKPHISRSMALSIH